MSSELFSALTRCHIVREIRLDYQNFSIFYRLLLTHVHLKKQAFGKRSYCEKVETVSLMIQSQARLPLAPIPSTNHPYLTDEYHIFSCPGQLNR